MWSLISWTKFLVLLEVGQYRRERFLKDGVDDKDGTEEDGKEHSVAGKPADLLDGSSRSYRRRPHLGTSRQSCIWRRS
jgi:hypothetical protein